MLRSALRLACLTLATWGRQLVSPMALKVVGTRKGSWCMVIYGGHSDGNSEFDSFTVLKFCDFWINLCEIRRNVVVRVRFIIMYNTICRQVGNQCKAM